MYHEHGQLCVKDSSASHTWEWQGLRGMEGLPSGPSMDLGSVCRKYQAQLPLQTTTARNYSPTETPTDELSGLLVQQCLINLSPQAQFPELLAHLHRSTGSPNLSYPGHAYYFFIPKLCRSGNSQRFYLYIICLLPSRSSSCEWEFQERSQWRLMGWLKFQWLEDVGMLQVRVSLPFILIYC